MFACGLYKAIQMMDSNLFALEKGNQYLSAGVFFFSNHQMMICRVEKYCFKELVNAPAKEPI